MAFKFRRKVRASQPQYPVPLETTESASSGLIFAAYALDHLFYDAVSNELSVLTSLTYPTVGPYTPAKTPASFDAIFNTPQSGGAYNRWATHNTKLDSLTSGFTIFVEGSLGVANNGSSSVTIESVDSGSGNGIRFLFDDAVFNTNGIAIWVDNNNKAGAGGLGTNSEQFFHRVLATADGTNMIFYGPNNTLLGSTANAALPSAGANRRTSIGGNFSGTTNQCTTALVLVWNRILTAGERQRLFDNPWRVFSAGRRRRLVGGGTNTYTITPSGGIVFSGAVPELRTRQQVPSGGVVFSGSVPQLRTRQQVPAGGIVFAGSVSMIRTRQTVPAGGILFGGTAAMTFTPAGGGGGLAGQRTLVGVGT